MEFLWKIKIQSFLKVMDFQLTIMDSTSIYYMFLEYFFKLKPVLIYLQVIHFSDSNSYSLLHELNEILNKDFCKVST